MSAPHSLIDVFRYSNYRLFLDDYIRIQYLERGKSYRAFAKRCGIASPNYFQQVINGQKNMTPQTAEKIVGSLSLPKIAAHYFMTLVRLDGTQDPDKRFQLLGELRMLTARHKKKTVKDDSFHSEWIHQIIWTLAHIKDFPMDSLSIQRAIRSSVTLEEVEQSLLFLQKKGYLAPGGKEGQFLPQNILIETDNDIRSFNLQRNHNRFLQVAQMRLNDVLSEREFQGMTIAFSKERIPELKEQLREFIKGLSEKFEAPSPDVVLRIQMAAFIIADSKPKV